jgi:hypothetical protein
MDIGLLKKKAQEKTADPRRAWGNKRHKLEDILIIGLTTLLCNGDDYEDMEIFGQERENDLKRFLELPNGIPDESTFCRVFQRIKPEELAGCLYSWIAEARELEGTAINTDGKTIRGSSHGEKKGAHGPGTKKSYLASLRRTKKAMKQPQYRSYRTSWT